ncbi:MAG: secreted trypsin-like serine protease [Gammaproteobacteria bacterium]|jgi:secreted trypsin-like serine protease
MKQFIQTSLLAGLLALPVGIVSAQETTSDAETNSLIVGGTVVPNISDVPWQAAIVMHGTRSQFCGGSLVAPGWVMTAAHCVDTPSVQKNGAKIDVVLGTLAYATGGEQLTVSEIFVHPNWDPATMDFDAALLQLSTNASQGTPIALNTTKTPITEGILVRVTGWGRTQQGGTTSPVLLEVDVPAVSTATCNEPASYGGDITSDMFCAGYAKGGKDACQGDSGGPSDFPIAGVETLVGIVSWGSGCAQARKYGVYTRVARIEPWATQTMGN